MNKPTWTTTKTEQYEKTPAKKLNEWESEETLMFFFQAIKEYPSSYNTPGSKEKGVLSYIVALPAYLDIEGEVIVTDKPIVLRANNALLDRVKGLKNGQLIEIECTGKKVSASGYSYVGFKTLRQADMCQLMEVK